MEQELRMREVFFFSSFFFLFVSFLPFFLIFFLFRSRKWGRNGVRMDADLFPLEFLFMEKNQGINWKNSKEVLLLFPFKFLYFFFLLILLPFSFWERNWKIGRIKMCAPNTLKRFCKNIVVFKISFLGKKIRQKFIFYTKNTLKNAKNQTFFAKNIFWQKLFNFWRNFWRVSRRSFYASKKF